MESIEGYSLAVASIGDERSEVDLAGLVSGYSALLYRVAYSVLRSGAEAEDVVQDVFVRVIQYKGSLAEIREMRVWLVRIAWNLALDRRRRVRPEQLDERFAESIAGEGLPVDVALVESQRMQAVLREMERLPKAEKHVLLLSAVDQLSTGEIAAVVGRSESGVRALLFRARTRLRERLEKEVERR